MAMFDTLGIVPQGRMPSGRGMILRDGREHALPATPVSMLSTSVLDLRSKFALVGFFAQVRRVDASALRELSCREWLEKQVVGKQLRELLAAVIRLATYCAELDDLSAEAAVQQLRAAFGGVLYLDGGWEQLVDALVERARAAGVEFRFGAPVEAIARADHARWAVQVDGSAIPCADVVIASSPRVADTLLGSSGLTANHGLATAAQPCKAACLDLGLRGEWPGPRFLLDIDEPIYLSVHSDVAAVAPAGHTLLSLIWYRRATNQLSGVQVRERLEQVVRRWMPNFEEAVVVEQFLPDITVMHDLPQARRGGLAGRAPTQVGEGLYLVGDWVGDRGMLLDASMASAAQVCEAILGEEHRMRASA
jgi:phytoene dehydrogenase-like protein